MPRLSPKKRLLWTVAGVALTTALAFTCREFQTPLSGGGKPDGFFTIWAKNRAYSIIPTAEDRAATRLTSQNGNGWFGVFAEPVQSLALYQSQNPQRPTPIRRTLVLQPLGALSAEEKAILADCKVYCEAFFELPTRIAAPISLDKTQLSPRPGAKGVSKTQLNSSSILQQVLAPRLPDDAAAYLGIVSEDLWADDLNFVFGQATFHQRVGVYSLARYFPTKRDPKLAAQERQTALRRTAQVLTHEAGHMFGLTHCVLYQCTMNGMNSLADSDGSPLDYCPICARKLAWNIGYNRAGRDAKLQALQARFKLK